MLFSLEEGAGKEIGATRAQAKGRLLTGRYWRFVRIRERSLYFSLSCDVSETRNNAGMRARTNVQACIYRCRAPGRCCLLSIGPCILD